MSKQTINIGASPNDGTGTPLRTSFDYTNQNFTEIYTALGGGVALPGATTQVIFNDGGTNLAGDAGLVYNKTTDALTVAGLVTAGSATITGDLTVDTSTLKVDSTNNRVGILTATPNDILEVVGSGATGVRVSRAGLPTQYATLSAGATGPTLDASSALGALSFGLAGTTAMTLNSTGLGIGIAPESAKSTRLSVYQTGDLTDETAPLSVGNTAAGGMRLYAGVNNTNKYCYIGSVESGTSYRSLILQPNGGNVGVGVTPSAWGSSYKSVQTTLGAALAGNTGNLILAQNCYYDGTNWVNNRASTYSSRYDMNLAANGVHAWYVYNASFGTVGNTIPFAQAMTLDASGNLYVAKTSSSSATTGCELQTGAGGNAASVFTATAATVSIMNRLTSDGVIVDFRRQTSSVGNISVTTLATTYNSISDYRLKEDVQPLVGGLARVSALKPSIYKWKANGSAGEGFLAHELASVVSAAVTGEKDAVNEDGSINAQSIDMSRIVPILVAAIQELTAEVNALKNA